MFQLHELSELSYVKYDGKIYQIRFNHPSELCHLSHQYVYRNTDGRQYYCPDNTYIHLDPTTMVRLVDDLPTR